MNRIFHTCKGLVTAAVWVAGFCACNYTHDDSLPECEYRLHFKYDYNMKFADALQHEVDYLTLFFHDADGHYLFQRHIEKSELDSHNSIALDLEPGTYRVVTWAGLDDKCYEWRAPQETSTDKDCRVKTLRRDDATLPDELTPLWHSLDLLTVTRDAPEADTVSLAKNTNKVRLVLQDTDGNCMDVRDFTFRIVADNGYMDYDNQLLADPAITYLPYYTENVNIAEGDSLMGKPVNQTVAVAEMNTMRLMARRNYRLIVRHKEWKEDVINVNLNNYLLLTQMEGHNISAQEYLDRQDEYSIIFFLTPTYCPDCPDPGPDPGPDPEPIIGYRCYVIQVKDWVIRLNDFDL